MRATRTCITPQTDNGTLYQVIVAEGTGSVTSAPPALLSVGAPVTASSGGNQTICAGSATAGLGGTVGGGATGGLWTSAGAGSFAPNSTTLNATYTPSAAEVAAGTATLTLTTTGQSPACTPDSTQVIVTIHAPPAISGEPANLTVCAGTPAVFSVTATGTGVTYQWQVSYDFGLTFTNLTDNATYASYTNQAPAFADDGIFYQVVLSVASCASLTSTAAELAVLTAPTADAGLNHTVCASSPATALSGSFGGSATSATWSGDGTFAPDHTSMNVTYTPTAAEISAGTATVSLTAASALGDCPPTVSTTTITINPAAQVSAGPNQTVCASSPITQLAGSIGGAATSAVWRGDGTFSSRFILAPTYTPTAAEISAGSATVTLTSNDPPGPCGVVASLITITINPVATASAGGNQTICEGSSTLGLGGTVGGAATGGTWSSATGGNFSPDATTLNATYTPTAADISAGAVTLTLTTDDPVGPCGPATAHVVVTIRPAATVSTGGNQTICADQVTTGLGGTVDGGATGGVWTSAGAGSFAPNATTLNATYTPSAAEVAAGTATLTLTTTGQLDPCPPATAQLVVTIHALPAITGEPANLTVCAGSPAIFSVTATGTALTYQWQVSLDYGATFHNISDTETNASYTNLAPTLADSGKFYQVIVGGACPPAVTSAPPVELTIDQPPTVQVGAGQTVCASSPAATLSGSFGGGATTATWSGAGTFAPNATTLNAVYTPTSDEIAAGTATVTLTASDPSASCPAVSATTTITINPAALVSAGPNQTVCASSPNTHLAGAYGGAATGSRWTGAGRFVQNAFITNAVYIPTAAEIAAGTATVTLTTSDPSGPCGPVSASMTITIAQAATASAGGNQTICSGSPTTALGGTVGGGATGGLWTSSGTGAFVPDTTTLNATYTPSAADASTGTVTLTLTSTGQLPCTPATAHVVVTVHLAATASAGANQTVCSSSPTVTLAGTFGGGATGATWSGAGAFAPDQTTMSATYTPTEAEISAGSATVTLTSSGQVMPCEPVITSMTITINPAATASAGGNQTICADQATTGLGGTVGGGATGGLWTSSGAGTFAPDATTLNATYTPSEAEISAGTATLTLTSTGEQGPCTAAAAQVVVTINALPAITGQPANVTVCAGSPAIFCVTATGTALTYQWQVSGDGGVTFTNISDTATNACYTNEITTVADNGNQYQVIVSGACTPAQTSAPSAVLTVNPLAAAGAGGDQTIFAGHSTTGLGGTVGAGATGGLWTSTGTGSFAPDTTTLDATYTPSEADITAGTVTLTLTAEPCPAGTAQVVVTIRTAASASTGGNQTICAGQSTAGLGWHGGQWRHGRPLDLFGHGRVRAGRYDAQRDLCSVGSRYCGGHGDLDPDHHRPA